MSLSNIIQRKYNKDFANFEEVVQNFGRSDEDIIERKNAYFQNI